MTQYLSIIHPLRTDRWMDEWETDDNSTNDAHQCYFPSVVDGKVSKCEAIFHLPRRKKEHADAIFRPCRRKSMCSKHYFPSPGTKDQANVRLFSVRHQLKSRLYDVIFHPPWTFEDFDWWKKTQFLGIIHSLIVLYQKIKQSFSISHNLHTSMVEEK